MTAATAFSVSCGGDGPGGPAGGTTDQTQGGPSSDFLTVSANGGAATKYTEKSGLPDIDCDPRVDWAFNQIVGWADFTNGPGPNGYDLMMDIMFAAKDTVGTYSVQGDFVQVLIYNGTFYTASPVFGTTSGTVVVTRADTRIEGTYDVTASDSSGTLVDFSGSFGVASGFDLDCTD